MALDIPLPAPPPGGFYGGANAANQLARQFMENQFYPQAQQAEIASRSTYAKYLPAQILGQVLSNPLSWQTLPKEQLQNLVNQYSNAITNPPSLNQLTSQPSMGGGLISMLMDKLGSLGNQQNISQQGNALNQPPSSMSPTQQVVLQKSGTNDQVQPDYTKTSSQDNLASSQISRLAPNIKMPGSFGGINPATVNQAAQKALETTATGEAKAQIQQWKGIQDDANEEAKRAQNNINYLSEVKNLYPRLKSYEKGPLVFGRLPAMSNAATQIDAAANALADSVARAQQQGHITQMDRATYSGMKPSRAMPEESFNNTVNFNEAMNRRILERPAFNNAAQQYNLNPTQAQAVWSYYASQRPFYDSKNDKINENNLGSWEEFLTPKNVAAALSPKVQKMIQEGKRPEISNLPKSDKKEIENTAKQFKSNVSVQGEKSLARGLQLPKFDTKEEFQKWFSDQPTITQEAVRRHLRGS